MYIKFGDNMKKSHLVVKILLTVLVAMVFPVAAITLFIILAFGGFWEITVWLSLFYCSVGYSFNMVKEKKALFNRLRCISFMLCHSCGHTGGHKGL